MIISTIIGFLTIFVICLFLFILPAITHSELPLLFFVIPFITVTSWMLGDTLRDIWRAR